MSGATDNEAERVIAMAKAIDQLLGDEADKNLRLAAIAMALEWQVFELCDTQRDAIAYVEAVAGSTIDNLRADWAGMVMALHGGVQ